MLRSLSLKTKLIALCLLLSTVSVVVGIANFINSRDVVSRFQSVTTENVPKLERVNKMFLEFRALRISLRTLGFENLPAELSAKQIADVHTRIANFDKHSDQYRDQPFAPGEKVLYDDLMVSWVKFKALGDEILKTQRSTLPADHKRMMNMFMYDCPEQAEAFSKKANALITFQENSAATRVASAENASTNANTLSLVLIVLGTLLGLVIGYWLSSSIEKELRHVAQGLADQATAVSEVAGQISASSEELSVSTNQQATALQQTTAAVEETSSMVARNADNARASADVSKESEATVLRGREAVETMLSSIEEISESNTGIMQQIELSNQEISHIVKVIAEIGNKTKVINDIVFQTKLLSFNASVEAARAGEHGKGFAVVAEEVGKLAQMSGNAAKEISEMLDSSIKQVEGIVASTQSKVSELIQSGNKKVQAGSATAKRCSDILDAIVMNVSKVGTLVEEISTASQEQSRGIAEINRAVIDLDGVAGKNRIASQDASVSAQDLNNQVDAVRNYISELEDVLNGNKRTIEVAPTQVEAGRVVGERGLRIA